MYSRNPILRQLGLGLAVLGVVSAAHAQQLGNPTASPEQSTACCQLTTSLVNDVLRGKDVSGDERFFSAEGAPPNIHFLVDTSGSMRELPQVLDSEHSTFLALTTNGCDNPRLDAFQLSRGWDPNIVYPIPDPGTGMGSDTGFPSLFQDDKFYGYMYWGDLSNPTPQWNTKEEACQSQVTDYAGTGAVEYARCLTCLSTKGFFKEHEAEGRDNAPYNVAGFMLWGRFLNFNPPKYVTAKAVLKSVIKDLKRVRAGISYFTSNSPNTAMLKEQNPSCQQIINDSSSFDSNRASYINAVNGLNFSTGTPLARSLLNVGYYFTSDDTVYRNVFGFGANYSYPSSFKNDTLTSQGRSVCWGCQVSSVIIITDGEPSGDNLPAAVVTKLRQLQGAVYCPDALPCGGGTTASRDKGTNPAVYTDDNPQYMLDDVAKLLFEQDLQRNTPSQVGDFNTAGKQNVITYTVGFGINSNFLRHTAEVGGGLYYTADDAASLKQALLDIITNVQTRATSFSSPAASTLQVRSASVTLIPRFKPARNKTAPWQGFLYRFKEGKERLLGCDPANPGVQDLNQDGDCNDTLLLDAEDEAIIENDEGNFIKLLDSQNGIVTPAVAFWEAGERLKAGGTQKWMTRKIYTIIDSNTDGKVDFNDTPIRFSQANSGVLREFLGISQNPTECSDLAGQLGEPLTPDDCAKLVIRWYLGADALNPDPSKRDLDRPFLLHDIFHSSPVNVDPPIPARFCGFSQACSSALFAGATPLVDSNGAPAPAYELYQQGTNGRDKIVLVGSNGGMLHAFHSGKALASGDVDTLTGQRLYDDGTGQELWGFVPPDLLPKMRPNLGKHAYFVDGTPMVRDVWMDGLGGAADGKKEPGEYRTVAVVGTGRGGVHRFALDLTRLLGKLPDEASTRVPDQTGDFLWLWPQPCDPLALQVGESFTNYAPQPPPILPVALTDAADDALRAMSSTSSGGTGPWTIDSTPAHERWVVVVNGGFDEHMLRGRGFAVVDMRTGHTVWSFFYGDGQSRSEHLRYPIGTGLSVLDIGQGNNPVSDADRLFDSATVGDYGGQLWMVRMWKPGAWDATKKQVNNWLAARAFRVANLAGDTGDAEAMRAPFSYMTVNTLQPDTGFLRTFAGTSDRENLLEKGTGCRLSNPRACAVQGCGVNNTLTVERGTLGTYTTAYTANATYQGFHYSSGSSLSTTTAAAPGPACAGARVTLNWNNDAANGCGNANDGSLQYTCDGNSSTWSCRETANTWTVLNYVELTSPYPQRYYGVWTYGGTALTRRFDTEAQAATYDNSRFTDTDLVNVSNFNAAGEVVSNPSAAPSSKGWFLQYGAANERTGTTGTLINGCVLWSTFEPSGSSGAVCSTTGTNIARLYQSNFATGEANCAVSFYRDGVNNPGPNPGTWERFKLSTTVAAPAEPALQVGIGGGLITIDVNQQGPGQSQTTQVGQSDEGVKSLYQMELDRRGHDCRHLGDPAACN
ncbi:pilus assembly protein PilY [Hyalangium sp.]|uniref:pilus assembly protein PilY n=1 Tax=Hyalangium sp. TaxID=2028555 RepID=UPI002D58F300|nr:pilus assembly protein PilY [Hyalangium sp.]HYH94324.1 pilus assembly protein PilY [Hyalangium sp.]